MSYTKTNWVDRIDSGNEYNITDNPNGTKKIEYAGTITRNGTPFSADNMNHLENGVFEATETADNAVIALNEVNNRLNLFSPASFTISTSDWVETDTAGYCYYADITDNNISVNDCADVLFALSSMEICQNAEISSAGETLDGKIRLYSMNIPEAAVSGSYIIYKGA